MANLRATSRAGDGSILPRQLASLLEPAKSARASRCGGLVLTLMGSIGLAGRRQTKYRVEHPRSALGGQKTEGRGQKTEDRGQKTEDSEASLGAGHPTLDSLAAWCSRQRPAWLTAFSAGMVVLVGSFDYATWHELSLAILYLLPIMFAAWFAGKHHGMFVAVLACLVWLTADVASSAAHLHFGIELLNLAARVVIFTFVVLLLARIRALQNSLKETIATRTAQLEAQIARGLAMEREVAAGSHREQQRIAHELHDGLGQELGGLAFRAKLLAAKLAEERAGLADEAESLVALLNQTMARTRALSHLLDPLGGESGGLRPALSRLVEESARAFDVTTAFDAPETLPEVSPEMAVHLYRIAQEAIHNAVNHGLATSIWLHVGHQAGVLTLSVANNGAAFITHAAEASPAQGMGLRIMHYRAAALGARLQIKSAPGAGCQVLCSLPLNGAGRA